MAALVEPLAVAWHAVNASPFKPSDSVLVLGGGPIGLSVIQALKARGCRQIIVSEVSTMRKQYAKDFGAHVVLDPTKDDIVARCRELADGQGVNVTFDAAGVQSGLDQALLALRARGTHVNIVWKHSKYIHARSAKLTRSRPSGRRDALSTQVTWCSEKRATLVSRLTLQGISRRFV